MHSETPTRGKILPLYGGISKTGRHEHVAIKKRADLCRDANINHPLFNTGLFNFPPEVPKRKQKD
jgi:hypothetical protein